MIPESSGRRPPILIQQAVEVVSLAKLLPVPGARRAHPTRREPVSLLEAVGDRATGQMAAENFPVALRLLPAGPRRDLTRVYTYARFVDDVGDEAPGDATARLALLDDIEREVRSIGRGGATLPAVRAITPLVETGRVPLAPFLDLIEANRVDQRTGEYETFDDLMAYCGLSAAPVGRIVLHLAGAATPENVADSDAVCNALQVLEHCQDVGEDFGHGRCYLPAAELRAAGVGPDQLAAADTAPPLRRVVARQVDRARAMLGAGGPLVGRLSGWARFAVAGYVAGGLATADALDAGGHDVLSRTITPSKLRTAGHAVRLLRARR
jgi:squalene synthase HpnC